MQPVHKNKPDSSGLVPGISLGAVAMAEVDGRNKSGHDGGGQWNVPEYESCIAHPGIPSAFCM